MLFLHDHVLKKKRENVDVYKYYIGTTVADFGLFQMDKPRNERRIIITEIYSQASKRKISILLGEYFMSIMHRSFFIFIGKIKRNKKKRQRAF